MERKRERKRPASRHPGHPATPRRATEPCRRFSVEHNRTLDLYVYIYVLADRVDTLSKRWEELPHKMAEAAFGPSDEDRKELRAKIDAIEKTGAVSEWRKLLRLISEMVYCRGIDNYLTYVSEILALVFRTRPETLRSDEKVALSTVLAHPTMEELVRALAELKVHQLSYRGMEDLASYLASRLKWSLFVSSQERDRIVKLVERRNLIVHNRGVINDLFRRRYPGESVDRDGRIKVSVEDVRRDFAIIARSAYSLDRRTAIKFTLGTGPIAGRGRKAG